MVCGIFDDPRDVVHSAIGAVVRAYATIDPFIAVVLLIVFVLYEAASAWVKRDCPAADVVEMIIGYLVADAYAEHIYP